MSSPSPRYRRDDVLQEIGTERRLLVVAVGVEAYFVRRLGVSGEGAEAVEPLETAWGFEGCEEATVRVG